MNLTLLLIIVFILLQLALGYYISRRIRSEEDYIIAGRQLGYLLTTFTIFATWFGSETCIGSAGAIYTHGLSGGTADPFGYALCIFGMGFFLARPIWKMGLSTMGDYFNRRYDRSVEKFSIALMVPTSLFWAAAQIRAFGQVISASSGFAAEITITFAAAVVIVYTVFGGLLADVYTDLFQGIILIAGLLLIFLGIIQAEGMAIFQNIAPERLRLIDTSEHSWMDILEAWAIPVVGSMVAAELVTRAMAAKAPGVAQRSAFMAGGLYLAIGLIPVTIGLLGPTLIQDLSTPEQILPLVGQKYLSPLLYSIFAAAIVSAILSTVDSSLLVSATLISHNILVPRLGVANDRKKVIIARTCVGFLGLLAYGMAMYAEGVYALVEEASAFGSAGLFVVVFMGIFSKLGTGLSANLALAAGLVSWVAGAYWLELEHPYLTSLLLAFLGYGLGLLLRSVKLA